MKKYFIMLVLSLLTISSCISQKPLSENTTPSPNAILSFTPSTTNIPTKAPTPTITFTPTPVPTSTDTGMPATANRTSSHGNYLKYDEAKYDVFQKTMHYRTVTVAIEKGFGTNSMTDRKILAEHIFNTWDVFWNEFGGFPFKSYTVVIGDNLPYDADKKGKGEKGEGFETSYDPYLTNYQYYSHGIYHAWNGNAFRQSGEGRWFMEGVTEYYGFRESKNTFYIEGLKFAYTKYKEAYDNGKDVALCTINDKGNPEWLHYWKGALVAYMLDKELANDGHNIGQVAKTIYTRYGVESEGKPTDKQILAIIAEVSGKDFTDFYNNYICGTEPLPLDGIHFDKIPHE